MQAGLLPRRRSLARTTWLLALVCAWTASAFAQDWPMPRHDPQRTARQEAPGNIRIPAVLWSISLGSRFAGNEWAIADTNGDGQLEAVLIRGGRVVARHLDGTLVWATVLLGITDIRAVDDFDGDGRYEVFAASFESGLFVVDGGTGDVLWRTTPDPASRLGDVFPLDADHDGRDELYVADRGCSTAGAGTGRVYSFHDGWDAPTVVTLDTADHGYWCGDGQAAGDVDGDGEPEIITLSHQQVVLYDPVTGAAEARSADIGEFPYGLARTMIFDVDRDGRDEILLASNNPGARFPSAKRLVLVEMEDTALAVRWQMSVDPLLGEHHFPIPAIADVFDAPGLEIATSLYDPAANRWEVRVFRSDSSTASPVLTVTGEALLALQDLDGDGFSELLTVEANEPGLPPFGRVRALKVSAGPTPSTDVLWSVDRASIPLHPTLWNTARSPVLLGSSAGDTRRVLTWTDADSDGRPDGVVGMGGVPPFPSRDFAVGLTATSARPATMDVDSFAMTFTNGSVGLFDGSLALQNDTDHDGAADLAETSYMPASLALAGVGGRRVLLTVDAALRPAAFLTDDTAPGGDPRVLWRRSDNLNARSIPEIIILRGSSPLAAFVATGAVAGLDMVFCDLLTGGRVGGARLPSDGTHIPFNDMVPLTRAGGETRLVVSLRDQLTDDVTYRSVLVPSGETTELDLARVATGGGDGLGSAYDITRDGNDDYLVNQNDRTKIVDGTTGLVVIERRTALMGSLALVDLDGDGRLDILHGGAHRRLESLRTDLSSSWSLATDGWNVHPASLETPTGVRLATAARDTSSVEVRTGDAGALVSSVVLAGGRAFPDVAAATAAGVRFGRVGDIAGAADVSGDGHPAYLVGSTDGHVYAVSAADATLDWAVDLRAEVGSPIVGDVTGDGTSEVVVAAGDGRVYAIGTAMLEAAESVFDTDGSFIAASADEDLDELPTASTLGGNWTSIAGATRYEYSVLREDDLVVVPWTDTGPATRFSRGDLALQLGRRYFIAVRGGGASGAVSPESLSDGFVVVDDAPPEVLLTAEPLVIYPGIGIAPSATQIEVTATDAVGLRTYRIEVIDPGGVGVRVLAAGAIAGLHFATSVSWDGTDAAGVIVSSGTYRVLATFMDAAGLEGSASAPVVVCRQDDGSSLILCRGSPMDAGHALTSDAAPTASTWDVTGGGCGCSTVGGSSLRWSAVSWIILTLLPLHRRGSRWRRREQAGLGASGG